MSCWSASVPFVHLMSVISISKSPIILLNTASIMIRSQKQIVISPHTYSVTTFFYRHGRQITFSICDLTNHESKHTLTLWIFGYKKLDISAERGQNSERNSARRFTLHVLFAVQKQRLYWKSAWGIVLNAAYYFSHDDLLACLYDKWIYHNKPAITFHHQKMLFALIGFSDRL